MTWLTDLIVAAFVLIGRHPAVPLVVMVVAPIAAAILSARSSGKAPFPRGVRVAVLLFIGAVIGNFFVGNALANRLIEAAGEDGQATVTSTRTLNETYNYHDVTEYVLSLRKADGRSVPVSTRSDDFNIASGRKSISATDGIFRVRYLRHLPGFFVFVAD